MSYQALARKWRPRTLKEVIGQEHVIRMLTNALDQQRLHHAYLFTGTRGVGKTTFARILAKCLNCEIGITSAPCGTCQNCTAIDASRCLDLLEIDAASRTKVEDTRELLDNIHYQPTQGRYKVYLIDEVHMLSGHSFNALLKTLEEPPPYVMFLLATTDPKRLPVTILSRCLQFNLKCIPATQIAQQLQSICTAEQILYEIEALHCLAQAANGSLRDALSLLDQAIAFSPQAITTLNIKQMLGSIEQDALLRLLEALSAQDGKKIISEIAQLGEFAADFNQALEDLLSLLHQINLIQILGGSTQPYDQNEKITQLAKHFTAEDIQLYYQIALIGRRDLPFAPTPQSGFEMVLLRMLAFKPMAAEDSQESDSTRLKTTPAKQGSDKGKEPPTVCSTEPPASSNACLPTNKWPTLLAQLGLTGMAYALAVNCDLVNITPDKITLALSIQHEPMLNKKLIERIEQALIQHFNKTIQLDITLISTTLDTPLKQQQQANMAHKTAVMETIKNDSEIQKIMHLFDATLDENSIDTTE
jgi:DNA polymerase-3 subunit gamma/tau